MLFYLLLAFNIIITTITTIVSGTTITVNTVDEYIAFTKSYYTGDTVILESDLDFTGVQVNPLGNDWNSRFAGVFDGQGHVISNLKIESSNTYVGLFGYAHGYIVGTPTVIRNLIFDETCSFTSTGTSDSVRLVGSFAGSCSSGDSACKILNCVNLGIVSFNGNTKGYVYIGGIGGSLTGNDYAPIVRNTVNYGTVEFTGSTSFQPYIGGIIGQGNFAYIQNTYNFGTVLYTGSAKSTLYIGGIAGSDSYGSFVNCVSGGLIKVGGSSSGEKNVGSIIGTLMYQPDIHNCYWDANIQYDAYGTKGFVGSDLVNCSSFNSNFVLNETISVGSYKGNSLVEVLNTVAEASVTNVYSKWMINAKNMAVKFVVNGDRQFYLKSQLMLLPSLLDAYGSVFEGWYTDSDCTVLLSNYKSNTFTTLYAKYN